MWSPAKSLRSCSITIHNMIADVWPLPGIFPLMILRAGDVTAGDAAGLGRPLDWHVWAKNSIKPEPKLYPSSAFENYLLKITVGDEWSSSVCKGINK